MTPLVADKSSIRINWRLSGLFRADLRWWSHLEPTAATLLSADELGFIIQYFSGRVTTKTNSSFCMCPHYFRPVWFRRLQCIIKTGSVYWSYALRNEVSVVKRIGIYDSNTAGLEILPYIYCGGPSYDVCP